MRFLASPWDLTRPDLMADSPIAIPSNTDMRWLRFEVLDVHQICGGRPVLSDEDRLFVFTQLIDNGGRLPLQRGHESRLHE